MKASLERLQTEDGIELVGLLYEPAEHTDAVLVHVHGMAGNFYENYFLDFIAQTLTNNNIAFFTFNNRGCELVKDLTKVENGKKSFVRIGNAFEKFEDSVLDIKAAVNFLENRGFSDIHVSGHSLGAPKVAYYLDSKNDRRMRSVLFISPADMVGLALKDKNYQRDRRTAEKMIADGHGDEQMPFLVWDENHLTAKTYIDLCSTNSTAAIFNFHDPADPMCTLASISIPAVTLMGAKDEALVIPVKETMERIEKVMVTSPKVETIIVGDANHAFTNHEQQLADAICTWIKEVQAASI